MEEKKGPEEKEKSGIQEKFSETKEKLSETFDKIKKNEKVEEIYNYASNNTRDTIAYIILALAIILMFSVPFWGGLLIGLVGGIYFSDELVAWVKNINQFIESQGYSRSVVIGGVTVGFFLAAPAIFIGAALAIGIKRMVVPE